MTALSSTTLLLGQLHHRAWNLWMTFQPLIMAAANLISVTIDTPSSLSLISFNMHGFYQGLPVLQDLVENSNNYKPDIILIQEHWLTPSSLHKFDDFFVHYFSFGSSAMVNSVQSGILYGRPYGGVITLISRNLRKVTETLYCSDRFTIIRIADYLIINVYRICHAVAQPIGC